MKKKNVTLASIIVLIIAGIAVIPLIIGNLKDGDSAKGTIGKVNKYSNQKISEKDIKLRSEFFKDTANLSKLISDLVNFNIFAFELRNRIDGKWLPDLTQFYKEMGFHCSCIDELKDFSGFLGNNIIAVRNLTDLLISRYKGQNNDKTTDIEAKIGLFVNFVSQMMHRDSVFEESIEQIDQTIKSDKVRKNQIAKLKKIKDLLIVDDFLYAQYIGDKEKASWLLKQNISNIHAIEGEYNVKTFDVIIKGSFGTNLEQVLDFLASNNYAQSLLNIDNIPCSKLCLDFIASKYCGYNPYGQQYIYGMLKDNAFQATSIKVGNDKFELNPLVGYILGGSAKIDGFVNILDGSYQYMEILTGQYPI